LLAQKIDKALIFRKVRFRGRTALIMSPSVLSPRSKVALLSSSCELLGVLLLPCHFIVVAAAIIISLTASSAHRQQAVEIITSPPPGPSEVAGDTVHASHLNFGPISFPSLDASRS
jgi:hypothetical protein